MSYRPMRPMRPHEEESPRKRPYSPPESPSRSTRVRNAIHRDVLFEQGQYPVFATFSARGSRAISCFRNGYARLYNVDPEHPRFLDCDQVLRHPESVFRGAVSEDGTRAVTTSGDGVARIWDLRNNQSVTKEINTNFRSTRTCDMSSDGRYVAVTFYTGKKLPKSTFYGQILLYDVQTDEFLFRVRVEGIPDKVKLSRDATVVAVGCFAIRPAPDMARGTRITLYDPDGNERMRFEDCFEEDDQSCLWWDLSNDGSTLAICGQRREAIEVYSDQSERTWRDAPLVLAANAALRYETCRIVDKGDLITALAFDIQTGERSILVFRPETGSVLFSLASGLSDPKSCLELEPRVCFVAPTFERPGRKVIRFLSRNTKPSNGTLELVRCGDPPKTIRGGADKAYDSSPPYSSRDNVSQPQKPWEALKGEYSPLTARTSNDTPPPRVPEQMDWFPAREITHSGMNDAKVNKDTLYKKTTPNQNDQSLSPSNPFRLGPPHQAAVAQNSAKRIPQIPEEDPFMNLKKEETNLTTMTDNSSKQVCKSRDPRVYRRKNISKKSSEDEKTQKPSENVLSPISAVATTSREQVHAKSETITCKSTITATEKKPSPPDGLQLNATQNGEPNSTTQDTKQNIAHKPPSNSTMRDIKQSIGPRVPSNTNTQQISNKILTPMNNNVVKKNNYMETETQQKNTERNIQDEPIKSEKTADANTGEKDSHTIPADSEVTVNPKKPRWQPGLRRARKLQEQKVALECKVGQVISPPQGKETLPGKTVNLDTAGQAHQQIEPSLITEGHANTVDPAESFITSNDKGKFDICGDVSCKQPAQGFTMPHKATPSTLNGPESAKKTSPETLGFRDMKGEPPMTTGNSGLNSMDKAGQESEGEARNMMTKESEKGPRSFFTKNGCAGDGSSQGCLQSSGQGDYREGNANNIVQADRTIVRQDCRRELPVLRQEAVQHPATKCESVLDDPKIKCSPREVAMPKAGKKDLSQVPAPNLEHESNDSLCKNRYFALLERAKSAFSRAARTVDGSLVLSSAKAYKVLLEVVGKEKELVDRMLVAKLVYKKGGGINNALDREVFLEAFAHLYEEILGVRRRRWTEVYSHAAGEDGEGLLVFHARDLIKQESENLETTLNVVWNDESLDELIASQTGDGVVVDQAAFVRSTDKIFSV